MKKFNPQLNWKIVSICLWMASTLSLAIWWMVWGIHHTSLQRHRDMLLEEGIFWMILLFGGGITLLWFVVREDRQTKLIKDFFSAFSHDLKTAIASLRLQTESLKADHERPSEELLDRLIADTVRIELQLENSLILVQPQHAKIYLEKLNLKRLIDRLSLQWPRTNLVLNKDGWVTADERALTSLLSNVIQNAIVHGRATHVGIDCQRQGEQRLRIRLTDNGHGFHGDVERLGRPYFRHNTRSGSGIGLFIVRKLAERMNGNLQFSVLNNRLVVEVDLPGGLEP